MNTPFELAVCAEMQFLDLPLTERVKRIGEYGIAAELWNWHESHVDLEAIAATGVPILNMNAYISGNLVEEDGIEEFLRTAELGAKKSKILGSPRLNFHGTGLGEGGIPVMKTEVVTGKMWAKATTTLLRLAEIAEKHDVVYQMENLNLPVDHRGTPFSHPEDVLALIQAVDSPRIRMNLDLYHAQIGDGNLIETCREALPYVGEIQVADVPGRCEPGTGEINYRNIAVALHEMGYTGTVCMEAWAKTDSEVAIPAFIQTFSDLEG
ncbi:MAG: TIM barrel protein [Actinomycetaceae bacterium]|nr:TIM barrel protein [Actinomycetaceae bacterium]